MYEIKNIETVEKLKEVFLFISKTFYLDYQKTGEQYFTMGERFEEMLQQFNVEKRLLYYIENENHEIIAALTTKNYNPEKASITLGMLCVKDEYTSQGIGSYILQRFEKDCCKKGIKKITLGARFVACDFYKKHKYVPHLMVQVFDFMTTEDVLKFNTYNFKVLETYEREFFGYVNFEVEDTKKEYIDYFTKLPTATALYVFTKELKYIE